MAESDSLDTNLDAEIQQELACSPEAELTFPTTLPALPLRGSVLFPGVVMPVLVGRKASQQLVVETLEADRLLAVVALRDAEIEEPTAEDLHGVATLARLVKVLRLPNGNLNVIVQGIQRLRLASVASHEPYIHAVWNEVPEQAADADVEIEAKRVSALRLLQQLIELSADLPPELEGLARAATRPGDMVDIIAAHLATTVEDKQRVLETLSPTDRLTVLLGQLTQQVQVLELSQKIESEVRGEFDRGQREIYLRERLRAIKRELGEEEDDAEIERLGRRINEAGMPDEVRKIATQELERLSRMSPAAAEHHVLRTYIDWILDMPWGNYTEDNLDLKTAAELLDKDHYDLEKVKKRIIEYLAVRKLKPDKRGPILCFIGPPGVGKTSLGRSIAAALGREFVRLSLGGVHDEAEIRGHRRTYVGSLPGRIIQGIKRAGSMNPVFMLDEIDKVGQDFRGDPSAALLEVLDPEQNDTFSDHYLEVDFDLSRVLFIATGNMPEGIPAVLRDRMEILDLPGYTAEEKVEIAQRYLVPRQLNDHGLAPEQLSFADDAIALIVRDYTEEAGVRGLEREIAAICRAHARLVAERIDDADATRAEALKVTTADLHGFLGPIKFFSDVAERTAVPGVAVGLAWTVTGGDILFIEATRMKGKGELRLTGQLGEVMKESAQAAMSYLRGHAAQLGIADSAFKSYDVHVHVPAGATPKDGPSAGVAILVALASLFTGRRVASDLGLTGELTLRGLALPVGGIKNKVLAAHRAGLKRVLMPRKNEKDLEEIPEQARRELEFVFIDRVEEAMEHALTSAPPAPRKTTGKSTPRRKKKAPRRRTAGIG
ncbi:MAG TPA: endopeptidase La [Acidobacteriota bacterium]|nr:endopeptidase La [Acidobacteriota bacterium]